MWDPERAFENSYFIAFKKIRHNENKSKAVITEVLRNIFLAIFEIPEINISRMAKMLPHL